MGKDFERIVKSIPCSTGEKIVLGILQQHALEHKLMKLKEIR